MSFLISITVYSLVQLACVQVSPNMAHTYTSGPESQYQTAPNYDCLSENFYFDYFEEHLKSENKIMADEYLPCNPGIFASYDRRSSCLRNDTLSLYKLTSEN